MSFFYSPIFILLLIIFSILIIILIISKIECSSYIIKEYSISSKKITNRIKIVYFSDLHNKSYDDSNVSIINDIVKINPDYVIIGGDLIDFSVFNSFVKKIGYKNTIKFLQNLQSISNDNHELSYYKNHRIFFQSGNHELRLDEFKDSKNIFFDEYNEFINCLNECGVNIVDSKRYNDDNDNVSITGFDMYEGYYVKSFRKDIVKTSIKLDDIADNLNIVDSSRYNIAIFHKPDYAEDFIDMGYDLVLSGHNHGGLVRFPFIGAIFSPDFDILPRYNYGQYKYRDKDIIVTSGLGEHFIKIRVNNKPEICVININNGTN